MKQMQRATQIVEQRIPLRQKRLTTSMAEIIRIPRIQNIYNIFGNNKNTSNVLECTKQEYDGEQSFAVQVISCIYILCLFIFFSYAVVVYYVM